MKQFLMTTVTWIDPAKMHPNLIDQLLAPHGDWMRVNHHVWFTHTSSNNVAVAEDIKKNLGPSDVVLCVPIDPNYLQGRAQPWIWDWFYSRSGNIATQRDNGEGLLPKLPVDES